MLNTLWMTGTTRLLPAVIAVLFGLITSTSFAAPAMLQQDATVDFETQIKPIFETHCVSCHKDGDDEGGYRMDNANDALKGIAGGDLDNSEVYQHMIGEEEIMPPEEEDDALSPDQIETVGNWITQGADWPEGLKLTEVARVQDAADATDDTIADDTTADDTTTDDTTTDDTTTDDTTTDETEKAAAEDETVYRAIGSLHAAAVHLPIGLLLAAGLFALFSLRGNFVMSDCAYYCLWLGTIGAIGACVTGWWYSPMENQGTVAVINDLFDQSHDVFWHRSASLICTAVALLLSLFAAGARAKDPEDGVLWKFGCIVLACGIGYTGHLGGELTYGENHYKDLNKLISGFMGAEEPGEEGDAADDVGVDDVTGTGETSEEESSSD